MVSSVQPQERFNKGEVAVSTLAFDGVYTLLVFLVTAGVYLDGWSHGAFGPDQSVFSEYHLLFYSALMALGLWLFGSSFLNRRDGFYGLAAIPAGYKLSALGLIIFGITGFIDLGGHALFGFEVDIEALYSPSHVGLFLGWALLCIGPTRAALYRNRSGGESANSWGQAFIQFLPALLAWIFFFNVIAFISMEFFATGELWMLTDNRTGNDYIGQVLGIMGIIIQSAVTVGALSYLILNFKMPAGSFSLCFLLFGLFGSIQTLNFDLVTVSLLVGILCDVLYAILRPSIKRQGQFHLFNALMMFTLWGGLYTFIFLTKFGEGSWYTPYIWTGSIVQGVAAGTLVSLLATASSQQGALNRV